MRLGFDAKRAFFNSSGLGNYSRSLIKALARYFPENEYLLYTKAFPGKINFEIPPETEIRTPAGLFNSLFPSLWRSSGIAKQIKLDRIDIFHGLSNELPRKIQSCKKIITIHDLIFLRYPQFYKSIDRMIYKRKSYSGCIEADRIIAISSQTKNDVVEYLGIPETKIDVVYQSCNPAFYHLEDEKTKTEVVARYKLPETYLLTVGTIEERKNLMSILYALQIGNIDMPLVVVGRPTAYMSNAVQFISENHLSKQVIFLHNVPDRDLPALYQKAMIFLYPSLFEGFGIPVLEALNSGIPVITSRAGCFIEAGGPGSYYIDPQQPGEIAETIKILADSEEKRIAAGEAGRNFALGFREEKVASELMGVYQKLLG